MNQVKQFFTQKIGPLPTWAWSGIIAGVLVGGILWFKKTQAANAATAAQTAAQNQQNQSASTISNAPPTVYNFNSVPDTSGLPPPPPSPTPTTTVSDFQTWLSHAFDGSRPDLLSAVQQQRWNDLTGQYALEVATTEKQQLGMGGGEGAGKGRMLGANGAIAGQQRTQQGIVPR